MKLKLILSEKGFSNSIIKSNFETNANGLNDEKTKMNIYHFYLLLKQKNLLSFVDILDKENVKRTISPNTINLIQIEEIRNLFTEHFKEDKKLLNITSMLVELTKEYCSTIQLILSSFDSEFDVNDKSLMVLFLGFVFESNEKNINNNNANNNKTQLSKGLYFETLNNLLLLSKYFNVFPFISNKELNTLCLFLIRLSLIYHRITKVSPLINKKEKEKETEFIRQSIYFSFPNVILYLYDLLSFEDSLILLNIIESEESKIIMNDLVHYLLIRNLLYEFFLYSKIYLNQTNRTKVTLFYYKSNVCNSILTILQNDYKKDPNHNAMAVVNETTHLLLLCLLYKDNTDGLFGIFAFYMTLFNDCFIYNQTSSSSIITSIIKQLIISIFFNVDTLISSLKKEKIKTPLIETTNIFSLGKGNIIMHYDIINFIFDLYNQFIVLQNTISLALIKEFNRNISDYQNFVTKTAFFSTILPNLYNCTEEVISYYFLLTFSLSDQKNSQYTPLNELSIIIHSLHKCNDYSKLMIIIGKIKSYIKVNENKPDSISKLLHSLSKEVSDIVQILQNENPNLINEGINNKDNSFIKDCKHKQKLIMEIARLYKTLLFNAKDSMIKSVSFNDINIELLFQTLIEQYPKFIYLLYTMRVHIESNPKEIDELIENIVKRYKTIITNKAKCDLAKELKYILQTLKIFFKRDKEASKAQVVKLYDIIYSIPQIICTQHGLRKDRNSIQMTEFELKRYIDMILKYISISNLNILQRRRGNYCIIKYISFKQILLSVIEVAINIDKSDDLLLKVIKYLIDKALHQSNKSLNENDSKEKKSIIKDSNNNSILNEDNIALHYINKYNITIDSDHQRSKLLCSIKSTFILQSPLLIIVLLKNLIKANKYTAPYLNFIELLCKSNDYNAKLLLKSSLIKTLLKLPLMNINYIPQVIKILSHCFVFLSQKDLKVIFKFLLIYLNHKQSIDLNLLLNAIFSLLNISVGNSLKIDQSITLASINVNQSNIHNFIYASGISLNSKNTISILISFRFHLSIDNSSAFTILKFQREEENKDKDKERGKDTDCFELSLSNSKLIIKENKSQYLFVNNIKEFISIDKEALFLIEINKENNQLLLYINHILFLDHSLEFISFSNNILSTYSLMIGYKDVDIYDNNNRYNRHPFVSLSYALIYLDRLSSEIIHAIKLCKITSSKVGSILSKNKSVPYLKLKEYQYISPSRNKNCLQMKINLDYSKISYELIVDSLSFINIHSVSNYSSKSSALIETIANQYNIQLSNKTYLQYINTSIDSNRSIFFNEEDNSKCKRTYLISKYNDQYELFKLNWIYGQYSLKNQINQRFVFIDNNLDTSVKQSRFLAWMIIYLHECESLKEKENVKETINNLISLLCSYLVINLPELSQLNRESYYLDSLIVAIYKNAEYISKDSIDMLFYLSYAFNGKKKISLSNVHNPWYSDIITELLLNLKVFNRLTLGNKGYLLSLIKQHIIFNDFTAENYPLSIAILNKLITFILLSSNNTNKEIDEEISKLVILLVDKVLRNKKGIEQANSSQLNFTINILSSFIVLGKGIDVHVSNHIQNKFSNEEQEYINSFIRSYFKKLYFKRDDDNDCNKNMIMIIRDTMMSHLKKHNLLAQLPSQLFTMANKESLTPKENKTKLTFMNDNSIIMDNKQSKTPSAKGIIIFDDNKNANVIDKNQDYKRGTWSLIENLDNDLQSNQITYEIKEEYICSDDCFLCKFIKLTILNEFSFQRKYIKYKGRIKSYYSDMFLSNKSKKDYLKDYLGISFSWALSSKEGPNRIRNKIISQMSTISNESIDRTKYDSEPKSINQIDFDINSHKTFESKFTFHDSINIYHSIVLFDQIFNMNIIEHFIAKNDKFEKAFNSIMIKGINIINSVFIIGKNNAYIFNNFILDQKGKLYISKQPVKKIFWTINDYSDILNKECIGLNALNGTYKQSLYAKENKFEMELFESYSFCYNEINEIHQKAFLHQDNAMEIFLDNGNNYFLAFNIDKRDIIWDTLMNKTQQKNIQSLNQYNFNNLTNSYLSNSTSANSLLNKHHSSLIYFKNPTAFISKHKSILIEKKVVINAKDILNEAEEKWVQGLLSNYDYIMLLNTISSRSYNDLSVYPVLPWLFQNSSGNQLQLNDRSIYRDLLYPIYAQQESSRVLLEMKYNCSDEEDMKYHSGSHYSTSAFVAYFLIRIKPFSQIAAEIQGGFFDTPDRLFYDLNGLNDVANKYQELIPEMFNVPEAFVNINKYFFDKTQSSENVDRVIMPKWALNNPRLYIKMNKKAIENPFVSKNISDWIDLMFGYKQNGKKGVEYYNIFRPVCSEFDPNKILQRNEGSQNEKEVDMPNIAKESIECVYEKIENRLTEIFNMGQNPIKLFNNPHKKKERHQIVNAFYGKKHYINNIQVNKYQYDIKLNTNHLEEIRALNEKGYMHDSYGQGGLSSFKKYFPNESSINESIYIVSSNKRVLLPPLYTDYIDYSKHKYSFSIVKPFNKTSFEFNTNHNSPITVIKALSYGKHIIIGYEDGSISKYKIINYNDTSTLSPIITNSNSNSNSNSKVLQARYLDPKLNISTSNIAHYDSLLSNQSHFILINPMLINNNYTKDNNDIFFHLKNKHQQKLTQLIKEKLNKPIGSISIGLINTNKVLTGSIKCIEICECYSMMITIDSEYYITLFDLNSFELIRQLNYKHIDYSGMEIRSIAICPHSGDFVLVTSSQINYLNINGVVLAIKSLRDERGLYGKMRSCIVKSIKITESDNYIFTGHDNGMIIIWSLEHNKDAEEYIDSYEFAYNRQYHYDIVHGDKENNVTELKLQMKIEEVVKIDTHSFPIELMKISEDESKLIVINSDNKLFYVKYKEQIQNKSNNNNNNSQLKCKKCVSSKQKCHICNCKMCLSCTKESIIAEYSLQTAMVICTKCNSKLSYSNRGLYDY